MCRLRRLSPAVPPPFLAGVWPAFRRDLARRLAGVWPAFGRGLAGVSPGSGRRFAGVWPAFRRGLAGVSPGSGRRLAGLCAVVRHIGGTSAHNRHQRRPRTPPLAEPPRRHQRDPHDATSEDPHDATSEDPHAATSGDYNAANRTLQEPPAVTVSVSRPERIRCPGRAGVNSRSLTATSPLMITWWIPSASP